MMSNSLQQTSSIPMRGRIEKQKLTSTLMAMERRLQIYLPPSYDAQPERHYPVLYVHYGQHIFEPHRPGDEAWHLHRLLEALFAADRIEELIVVGIAAERATVHRDYCHYVPAFQGAELGGMLFESFIVQELKPWIDNTYRTLLDRKQTAMVGASNSAAATYNIAQRHPDIFGKIGLLSPIVYSFCDKQWLYPTPLPKYEGVLWVGMGDAEGDYTFEVRDLLDALWAQGFQPGLDLFYTLTPDAGHYDIAWGSQVLHPLLLFFGKAGATPAEQIDRAIAVDLLGDTLIGISSNPLVINPLIHYDSGLALTALTGNYTIAQPQILAVRARNYLYGLAQGESSLTFTIDEVTATRHYRVMPTVPDLVHLHLRAHVPPETPDQEQIYLLHLPLTRTSKCLYEGFHTFPRNFALSGLFSWEMRKFEQRADGSLAPYRLLRATEDATIDYTIERWSGLDD
jgi:enterochelin esterase-like enzyme